MSYQPRYVAYAKSKGMTPEECQASESNMVGFMYYISANICEFKEMKGYSESYPFSEKDHEEFTKFLEEKNEG